MSGPCGDDGALGNPRDMKLRATLGIPSSALYEQL